MKNMPYFLIFSMDVWMIFTCTHLFHAVSLFGSSAVAALEVKVDCMRKWPV